MAKSQSPRSVEVAAIPVNKPNNFIIVSVRYDEGGMCYATYKQKPRGYYVSVSPEEREQRDGYTSCKMMLFSGQSAFLSGVGRFNAKVLKQVAEHVETEIHRESSIVSVLIDRVLTQNELKLAESDPPREIEAIGIAELNGETLVLA